MGTYAPLFSGYKERRGDDRGRAVTDIIFFDLEVINRGTI